MVTWSDGCVDGQAGLDLQYLSARYSRGKAAVADMIQKRHSILTHRTVGLAHGDVVEKQASLGPSTLLSCTYKGWLWLVVGCFC